MSSHTIEAFLYDLAYKAGHMQRFEAEPERLFDEYFMSAEDRADIRHWNVRAMRQRAARLRARQGIGDGRRGRRPCTARRSAGRTQIVDRVSWQYCLFNRSG